MQDVNDHAPQFEPHVYYLTLREGQKYTDVLLNLQATDEDRGENGQLHYFIEESTNDGAKLRLDQGKYLSFGVENWYLIVFL